MDSTNKLVIITTRNEPGRKIPGQGKAMDERSFSLQRRVICNSTILVVSRERVLSNNSL
jgi:hypothetical protein